MYYFSEQNTWEPVENMETCKHLLEAFEKQLARQKELKALRAQQQQHPVQVNILIHSNIFYKALINYIVSLRNASYSNRE